VQAVQAGLRAVYCSGWQVAGDGNSAGEMYPDQSLYPVDSVPRMVERINNALLRTDQIHHLDGNDARDWLVPLLRHLLQGTPEVRTLLGENPFPGAPPRYVRLVYYRYRFSTPTERATSGVWWQRERVGYLTEPLSLGASLPPR